MVQKCGIVPLYSGKSPTPPTDLEWLVRKEDVVGDVAWVPPFQEIRDLQIQRNDVLAVPLIFYFQCFRVVDWEVWVDREFADEGF